MKPGMLIAGLIGVAAVGIGMAAAKKAGASPRTPGLPPASGTEMWEGEEVTEEDKAGYAEAQHVQKWIAQGAACVSNGNVPCIKDAAHKLETYPYEHAEVGAAAKQAAKDLRAAAKDIEAYQKWQANPEGYYA